MIRRADLTLALPDEAATLEFAARCARALIGVGEGGPRLSDLGDDARAAPLVLHLHGDLGAGKTTFARGMLRALGEQGTVRSPTFALLAEYQPRGLKVLHLDLYRLEEARDLHGLALADHLPGSALWLIEWPDKALGGSGLPAADVHMRLEVTGASRSMEVEAMSGRGQLWLARLLTEPGL